MKRRRLFLILLALVADFTIAAVVTSWVTARRAQAQVAAER